MRILVIDDERDVLLLCRVNLEFAGHEVLEAASGEAGLRLIAAERPDVVVLDVMLPQLDGISVLEEIRRHEATANLPVVLLTARTRALDQLRGWIAGCSDYVTKPFSPTDLPAVLQRVHTMTSEERDDRRRRAVARLSPDASAAMN